MPYRVRTFIAVDVSPFTHDRLQGLREGLMRASPVSVKWVEPEGYHVTVLFLGDIDERETVDVCRAVETVCAKIKPFTLDISGVGAFPNLRRPRVLYANIEEGAEELVVLHAALATPLEEQGHYRREPRPYSPHLTIGRVQHEADAEAMGPALAKFLPWRGGQSAVGEVLVMSSELRSTESRYAVMSRSRLRGR